VYKKKKRNEREERDKERKKEQKKVPLIYRKKWDKFRLVFPKIRGSYLSSSRKIKINM
jgi:hypothetical protein